MGELLDRVKLAKIAYGNGDVESFRNNSLFLFESIRAGSNLIQKVPIRDVTPGSFYFIHYKDDSNWMRYSPVFAADFRKFGNLIVLLALNMNFVPVEVRVTIFDKFIQEDDFEGDRPLGVNYQGMYSELMRWGFEYALVEYNVGQIVMAHRVSMEVVPRFLNSQHPINKYDPENLFSIWKAKLGGRAKRHEEMTGSMLRDFYDIESEISEEFTALRDHVQRIQRSYEKYGR